MRAQLQALPPAAAVKRPAKIGKREVLVAQLVRRDQDSFRGEGLQVAQINAEPKGFVLDYEILTGSANFTFKSSVTYLILGNPIFTGTNTIEGGTVIKYTNAANLIRLTFSGNVDCKTSPYRPATFTSKDDDTVGEIISGSTGNPTNYYGQYQIALNLSTATFDLHDLHCRFGQTAIFVNNGTLNLSHSQIGFATNGIMVAAAAKPFTARNVLLHTLGTAFYGAGSSFTQQCEHITMHWVGRFATGAVYRVTNSLLISVTNDVVFTGANVVTNLDDTAFFQTVGAASHYLSVDSTSRNAGATNINPTLLADLKLRTTDANELDVSRWPRLLSISSVQSPLS